MEQVFGVPLDADLLTESVLAGLVDAGVCEREVLDFKQFSSYPATQGTRPQWTREQEFAKDVAAFANHRGGVLAMGIREENDVAVELLLNSRGPHVSPNCVCGRPSSITASRLWRRSSYPSQPM